MDKIREIVARIRPERKIDAISAVLLPFRDNGDPDLAALESLLERTWGAGLRPAVNMDTGYVNLLTHRQRSEILQLTRRASGGRSFVASAFIEDEIAENSGAVDIVRRYRSAALEVQECGGVPILFQCRALKNLAPSVIVRVYSEVAHELSALLAFELGEMFADFGQIYDLETVKGLIEIPTLLGMKHSSLDRQQEWARLVLRDARRPEFKIYTGNDLAIDMIMYGSDYLLGLSAFAPGEFALRDTMWQEGRSDFYSLNDLLQYLGYFAFRPPVPAYKHSAAQFLNVRGWIPNDLTHPRSARRPNSDKEILEGILRKLESSA